MIGKTKILFAAMALLMVLCLSACSGGWRESYESFLDDLVGKVDVNEEQRNIDAEEVIRDKLAEYSEGQTIWFRFDDFDGIGRPLAGEITKDYAMDCLSYNETTRDWRVHNGVDIAAQEGTPVCAAADGTVYTVYNDETMGMTVVIRHDGGYITKYASLAEDVSVKAGDKVTAGQTIGQVGSTALLENAVGDHLHFSVTCNGELMNPKDFLN